MHRNPHRKLFHQENDDGPSSDRNLPANHDKSNHIVESYPHLAPSFRSRSRRFLRQHIHYSAGPIILLWDEMDENIISADDTDVYDNDVYELESDQ